MNIAAYCRVSTDKSDQLNSLETQKEFFLESGRLQAFTLKEVAEELNMHESTISRAISNKSLRFKNREIPLKYFLSVKRQMETAKIM